MSELVIHKYPLPPQDEVFIDMPEVHKFLKVDTQNGEPMIWVLVNPAGKRSMRRFRVAGTGHAIDSDDIGIYIGTFFMHDGALVFHVFEMDK